MPNSTRFSFALKHLSGRGARKALRAGFSLIEILVAMTILTVIVLVVSEIFQQTSLAWALGSKRADAQSVTRAVVGAIGRDLAMMVDPANFVIGADENDESTRKEAYAAGRLDAAGDSGQLTGGLDFWILRPVDLSTTKQTAQDVPYRELVHVTYKGGANVTRTEEAFTSSDGGSMGNKKSTTFNLKSGSVQFSSPGADYSGYASFYEEMGVKITVKPATPETIDDYEIAVGSCGPDGKWGTEDDIRPWVEGEDDK